MGADDGEAEEMALRFYDQSHLLREFAQLFSMSPRPRRAAALAIGRQTRWRANISQTIASTAANAGKPQANQIRK